MMAGLGLQIWHLEDMPPAAKLLKLLQMLKAKWVSIKLVDFLTRYNQVGGNDKYLKEYIGILQSGGVSVGGWAYIYPTKCGPQAALMAERVEKLGIEHILLDAEGEWKKSGLRGSVELYLNSLAVKQGFPVGLCAYRYPDYHAPFPFQHFLAHERITFIAPQMYWIGAHNPIDQVQRSLAEYRKISTKPFMPIGPTFAAGKPGTSSYWEPTAQDLIDFVSYCRDQFEAFGFYSLDWIVNHKRNDWVTAIAGGAGQPAPLPELTLQERMEQLEQRVGELERLVYALDEPREYEVLSGRLTMQY